MKKRRIIALLLLAIVITGCIVVWLSTKFLTVNKPINSNTLLLEGWIPAYSVEQLAKQNESNTETRFIITGERFGNEDNSVSQKTRDYFSKPHTHYSQNNSGTWLYANSTLIFNPEAFPQISPGDSLSIAVNASGTEAGGRCAHFNLIVDGKSRGGRFVTKTITNYKFDLIVPPTGLNSLFIRFDNDLYLKKEDRNLFIESIIINKKEIPADKVHSFKIRKLSKTLTGFDSEADQMAAYLSQLGIDSSRITVIRFDRVNRNQTLAEVVSFKKWYDSRKLSSFNIVSSGVHCRRSWVTYKHIIGDQVKIGILSYDPPDSVENQWYHQPANSIHLADELFSYVSNWIILEMKGY